jgi:hypothetical protein
MSYTITLRPLAPAIPDPLDRATFRPRSFPWSQWQKADSIAANTQITQMAGMADDAAYAATLATAAKGQAEAAASAANAQAAIASGHAASAQANADAVAGATVNLAIPSMEDVADAQGDLQGAPAYSLPAAADGSMRVLERLGLFVYREAATDPADGETCIAPTTGVGRWLLQVPSFEFVMRRLAGVELAWLDGRLRTAEALLASVNTRALHATASLDFPSIAANSGTATLTVSVPGAAIGDRVALAPPAVLPTGLIPVAAVTVVDTVSLTLFYQTAAAIDPAAMTWGVSVLKANWS